MSVDIVAIPIDETTSWSCAFCRYCSDLSLNRPSSFGTTMWPPDKHIFVLQARCEIASGLFHPGYSQVSEKGPHSHYFGRGGDSGCLDFEMTSNEASSIMHRAAAGNSGLSGRLRGRPCSTFRPRSRRPVAWPRATKRPAGRIAVLETHSSTPPFRDKSSMHNKDGSVFIK